MRVTWEIRKILPIAATSVVTSQCSRQGCIQRIAKPPVIVLHITPEATAINILGAPVEPRGRVGRHQRANRGHGLGGFGVPILQRQSTARPIQFHGMLE